MKPHKVILCVERFDAEDGYVWAVRNGSRWLKARTVHVFVEMETVFRGQHSRQPKAYLEGYGIVREDGHGTITIAAA